MLSKLVSKLPAGFKRFTKNHFGWPKSYTTIEESMADAEARRKFEDQVAQAFKKLKAQGRI